MRPFRYKVFNLFKKSILFPDAVSSTVHGFCRNFFCWIYPFFYNFVLLISIRNKKMKSWFHPASPTYKQNKKPPTLLLSHLSWLAISLPSHVSQIATSLPPNLSNHATSLLSYLSYLATPLHSYTFPTFLAHYSPNSQLSQLTSLSRTNRSLQIGNILSLGRQGKHVWQIVWSNQFCAQYLFLCFSEKQEKKANQV